MVIGQLYPNRKEFHLEEVIGSNMISIEYFLAIDKIEDSELRVKILKDIEADHPRPIMLNNTCRHIMPPGHLKDWKEKNK